MEKAMDFLRAMDISATGLITQRFRMNIAAENLANLESTRTARGGPYCRKQVVISAIGDYQQFADIFMEEKNAMPTVGGAMVVDVVEDATPFKKIHRPGHPDADKDGFVSMPNVVAVLEIADIMAATRAYEANISAFSAAKSMIAKSMEIGK